MSAAALASARFIILVFSHSVRKHLSEFQILEHGLSDCLVWSKWKPVFESVTNKSSQGALWFSWFDLVGFGLFWFGLVWFGLV